MILTDISIVTKYANVSNELSIERLHPHEAIVKAKLKQDYFSSSLMNTIEGYASSSNPNEVELYESYCSLIVSGALISYAPQGELVISDKGMARAEDEFTKTAYSGQINRLISSLEEICALQIGNIISICQGTSIAGWSTSPAFIALEGLFFKSSAEFSLIYKLKKPQTSFLKLIPVIRRVQEEFLIQVIGEGNYTAFLAAPPTADVQSMIRRLIVYKTICISLAENLISISAEGIEVLEGASDNEVNKSSSPEDWKLSYTISNFEKLVKSSVATLKTKLISLNLLTPEEPPQLNNFFA